MVLGAADKNDFVREIYYNIETNEKFLPGKYIVDFYLYYNGIKVESITKDIDYFNIEKLSYLRDSKNTYIINESTEETEFFVYSDKSKKKYYKINGKDSIILNEQFHYIQYANNKIDVIRKKSRKLYYKNPEYKLVGNKLINIKNKKEFKLSKKERDYYGSVGNIINFIPIEFKIFIKKEIFLQLDEKNII